MAYVNADLPNVSLSLQRKQDELDALRRCLEDEKLARDKQRTVRER